MAECDYCGADMEGEDECPHCGGGEFECEHCGETVVESDYEQCGNSCPYCGN